MKRIAPSLAAALLALGASAHADTVYSAGFETGEGYSTGTLDNQPSSSSRRWSVLAGSAEVTQNAALPAQLGQYEVVLNNGAVVDQDLAGLVADSSDIVWIEGWFRGVGSNVTLAAANYPSAAQGVPASAVIHFSSANGIEFLNGDRAGGAGTVVPAGVPLGAGAASRYFRITVRLDFATRSYDVFVDGVKRNATPLGFRDNVSRLNGFRNLAENEARFDGFRIVLPEPGDANGDGEVSSADLVKALDYVTYSPDIYDPIFAANVGTGTQDGRIVVTAEDTDRLARQILNDPTP
jgi:hypothetical protein